MAADEQSALVVLVPAVEPLVAPWRARLDPSARRGLPAHVTILYPFVAPGALTDATLARLGRLFAEVPAFTLRLTGIGWFGDDIVYCTPEPVATLRLLTRRVVAAWPEYPPFGGAYAEVVPHVTIGNGAPPEELHAAAEDVGVRLPVEERVERVHLMVSTETADSWSVVRAFPLAG